MVGQGTYLSNPELTGEAADWLDRTVNVPNVNSLSLAECVADFERLKRVNAEIMAGKGGKMAPKRNPTKVNR
jgi:hypothetical protein